MSDFLFPHVNYQRVTKYVGSSFTVENTSACLVWARLDLAGFNQSPIRTCSGLSTTNSIPIISVYWSIIAGWWFSTPLKNISQLGLLFPICGKIKNVPNHQPDWGFTELEHGCCFSSPRDMKKQSSYHDNIHINYKHYNQIYSVYAPIYPTMIYSKVRKLPIQGSPKWQAFHTIMALWLSSIALSPFLFPLPVRTVIPGPATMTWDDKRGHHLGHGSPWPKKRTSHPPSESRFPQEK